MADFDAAAAAVTAPPGSSEWEPEFLSKLYSMTAAAASGQPADQPQPSSWRRVLEASYLREEQFSEDEGPLAHPIRPAKVNSLCALYTDTVYAKVGVWAQHTAPFITQQQSVMAQRDHARQLRACYSLLLTIAFSMRHLMSCPSLCG